MRLWNRLVRGITQGQRKRVDVFEAHRMQQQEGAVLVDVRDRHEWAAGSAPDSRHIPVDQIVERRSELPLSATVLTICRSGARSARAASLLRASGFAAIDVVGGMLAWQAAGLPVVTADGEPGRVI